MENNGTAAYTIWQCAKAFLTDIYMRQKTALYQYSYAASHSVLLSTLACIQEGAEYEEEILCRPQRTAERYL